MISQYFTGGMMSEGATLVQEVNTRFAIAVALLMAQARCDWFRGGQPKENWGSYPDGNVKAEWLTDGRSMKLLETIHYIDASASHGQLQRMR